MRHSFHAVFALALAGAVIAPAFAAPADDAAKAVTAILDKFNAGDVDAFVAAHRDGAVIIDEFAPYSWSGSGSAKSWIGDYAKDAARAGSAKDGSITRRRFRRIATARPPTSSCLQSTASSKPARRWRARAA